MRLERYAGGGAPGEVEALAATLHGLVAQPDAVRDGVQEVIDAVRSRGDEALRRLGVVRVATKYPKMATAHFEATGRQAEIVEVKGSVELAPLTGLVEAIVDLTATGTTLRENGLVIREEILGSTARLIANPVAHKLKARAIDDVLERARAR